METERILGLPVDAVTITDIIRALPAHTPQNKMTAISVNPQIALSIKDYPELVPFLENSTFRIPDGIGVVLVSKLTKGKVRERVAGIDLMTAFLEYANQQGQRIFLYGAKPEINEAAAENIQQQYPHLTIAGRIDGYTQLTDEEIVATMNQSKPDFVFVALGFPRQEKWLAKNYQAVDASVFQDVGGSFDVMSGYVKRAPAFFVNLHIEWLYRSLQHPSRFYRILQLPVFLLKGLNWHRHNQKGV